MRSGEMANQVKVPVSRRYFERNDQNGRPVDETSAIAEAAREAGPRVHRVWTDGIELLDNASKKVKVPFEHSEANRLGNRAMDLQRRQPGFFKPDRTSRYARGTPKTYVVDFDQGLVYLDGTPHAPLAKQSRRRKQGLAKRDFIGSITD